MLRRKKVEKEGKACTLDDEFSPWAKCFKLLLSYIVAHCISLCVKLKNQAYCIYSNKCPGHLSILGHGGLAFIIFSTFSASEDIFLEKSKAKDNKFILLQSGKTKCKSEHEQSISSNWQSRNFNFKTGLLLFLLYTGLYKTVSKGKVGVGGRCLLKGGHLFPFCLRGGGGGGRQAVNLVFSVWSLFLFFPHPWLHLLTHLRHLQINSVLVRHPNMPAGQLIQGGCLFE